MTKITSKTIQLLGLAVMLFLLIAGWYGYQVAGIRLLIDNFSLCS